MRLWGKYIKPGEKISNPRPNGGILKARKQLRGKTLPGKIMNETLMWNLGIFQLRNIKKNRKLKRNPCTKIGKRSVNESIRKFQRGKLELSSNIACNYKLRKPTASRDVFFLFAEIIFPLHTFFMRLLVFFNYDGIVKILKKTATICHSEPTILASQLKVNNFIPETTNSKEVFSAGGGDATQSLEKRIEKKTQHPPSCI